MIKKNKSKKKTKTKVVKKAVKTLRKKTGTRRTTKAVLVLKNLKDEGLRYEWIRFIDEYLMDFNGTRAYKVVFDEKMKSSVACSCASKLLRNNNVRTEIQSRMAAQRVTRSAIIEKLWNIGCKKSEQTINAAQKALETLAKVHGMIKPEIQTNNFFEGNVAIFQPIVDPKRDKEFQKVIEAKGKVIE
jgi:hypothetical protein